MFTITCSLFFHHPGPFPTHVRKKKVKQLISENFVQDPKVKGELKSDFWLLLLAFWELLSSIFPFLKKFKEKTVQSQYFLTNTLSSVQPFYKVQIDNSMQFIGVCSCGIKGPYEVADYFSIMKGTFVMLIRKMKRCRC